MCYRLRKHEDSIGKMKNEKFWYRFGLNSKDKPGSQGTHSLPPTPPGVDELSKGLMASRIL